jgi:hypothetical protein
MRDNFRYSNRVLRTIAENYLQLYLDGLSFKDTVIDGFELAEFICDFENGVSSLGSKFVLLPEFKDYNCNQFQKIIYADIFNIQDSELFERYHIVNPERMRHISYSKIKRYLNGIDNKKE